MHLLLADDDVAMRDLLEAVLSAHGHTVETHPDGESVWRAYEALPALMIILDWQMPKMDGLEVCRRVRAHPGGESTFLLVITSYASLFHLDSVLDAGADDYLSKPVTPEDVAARLRIAEKRMQVAEARRQAEAELRKARYLAGIGEVSLALQHEINNPLAALCANTSLITSGLLSEEEVKESLVTIDVQARRIADVVKRLNAVESAPRSVEYVSGHRMLDLGGLPQSNSPE